MSVIPEDDGQNKEDEIPRLGLLSSMPKRTFYRVVLLLAALAGIIYLRNRTATISGCMSNAFSVPAATEKSH